MRNNSFCKKLHFGRSVTTDVFLPNDTTNKQNHTVKHNGATDTQTRSNKKQDSRSHLFQMTLQGPLKHFTLQRAAETSATTTAAAAAAAAAAAVAAAAAASSQQPAAAAAGPKSQKW